jgi:hypothetical protein
MLTVANRQEVKTIQMSLGRCVKEMFYIYNETLYLLKERKPYDQS